MGWWHHLDQSSAGKRLSRSIVEFENVSARTIYRLALAEKGRMAHPHSVVPGYG